jgi:hypothetical protein
MLGKVSDSDYKGHHNAVRTGGSGQYLVAAPDPAHRLVQHHCRMLVPDLLHTPRSKLPTQAETGTSLQPHSTYTHDSLSQRMDNEVGRAV